VSVKSSLLSLGSDVAGVGSLLTRGGGAIGTLNPATGALVPSSGLASTALSLLSNPWTIGIGAGLAGAAIWIKSQGHRKANEWTKGYQTPWGDKATGFMNDIIARRQAGTLTYDEAKNAQQEFNTNVADFWDNAELFKTKGGQQKTVIDQAHTKLDPIVAGWQKTLQESIDQLAPNPTAGVDETKPPALPVNVEEQTNAAAEEQRKRSLGMKGRSSTILTGPSGLKNERVDSKRTLLAAY
jgi:hypothetical protein